MKHNFNFDCPHFYKDLLLFDQAEFGQTFSQTVNRAMCSFRESLFLEPVGKLGSHRVHVGLTPSYLNFLEDTSKAFGRPKGTTILIALEHYRCYRNILDRINQQ